MGLKYPQFLKKHNLPLRCQYQLISAKPFLWEYSGVRDQVLFRKWALKHGVKNLRNTYEEENAS